MRKVAICSCCVWAFFSGAEWPPRDNSLLTLHLSFIALSFFLFYIFFFWVVALLVEHLESFSVVFTAKKSLFSLATLPVVFNISFTRDFWAFLLCVFSRVVFLLCFLLSWEASERQNRRLELISQYSLFYFFRGCNNRQNSTALSALAASSDWIFYSILFFLIFFGRSLISLVGSMINDSFEFSCKFSLLLLSIFSS